MRRRTYLSGLSAGVAVLGGCTTVCGCSQTGIDFESEYQSTTAPDYDGVVEIRHEAGDSVDPNFLFVEGEGLYPRGDGTWGNQHTSPSGDDIWGDVTDITSGATIYVSASSDWRLRLVWSPQEEDAREKLHDNAGGRLTE